MPRVPPAVLRTFDLLQEILNVADEKLRQTFILKGIFIVVGSVRSF